jgi:hypothetical protein
VLASPDGESPWPDPRLHPDTTSVKFT